MSGLNIPWDLTFTPDGTMLVTERAGRTLARLPDGTVRTVKQCAVGPVRRERVRPDGDRRRPGVRHEQAVLHLPGLPRYRGARPIDIRVIRWSLARCHVGYSRRRPRHHRSAHQLPVATVAVASASTRPDTCTWARATRRSAPTHRTSTRSGARRCASTRDGTAPADNPFFARGGQAATSAPTGTGRPGPRAAARDDTDVERRARLLPR